MQLPETQTPKTAESDSDGNRAAIDSNQHSYFAKMSTTAQHSTHYTLPQMMDRDQRPILPPLQRIEYPTDRRTVSPLTTPPVSHGFGPFDPFQRQDISQLSPSAQRTILPDSLHPPPNVAAGQRLGERRDPFRRGQSDPLTQNLFDNGSRRPFDPMAYHSPSFSSSMQSPLALASTETRNTLSPQGQPQFAASSRSSYSDASTPNQTQPAMPFMSQGTVQAARVAGMSAGTSRLSLHIRQQPRAARAGPDGKDRRAIDPPPILQLLIDDFDIENEDDMNEMRSSYFVVHCSLVTPADPIKDVSSSNTYNEDGSQEITRILLGTAVSSPFFCQDDPDPEHMPSHPVTSAAERPPSPSSRFITSRRETKAKGKTQKPRTLPGSFFIFADLSVRKAGEYRLEFRLMKVDADSMMTRRDLPILNTIVSSTFKVVNAKDFDQVQPSTNLVKGLLDRGAGFPLKLKKGIREGQRKRPTQGESDEDEDDDDD